MTTSKINKLLVIGDINEKLARNVIRELVTTNWNEHDRIDMYITSEGGYLNYCFSIIDTITLLQNILNIKVNTIGLGEASSAAFFLLLLGDNRYVSPRCRIYVHEHITSAAEESYQERTNSQKEDKYLHAMYVNYTSDRLKISNVRAGNLLKKNRWLTDKEIDNYNIRTISNMNL